ncbi:MAG: dihydrofolate reductase [Bacteroidales bacterium]|nr:dihydrofolate reductase [Bacteroidales bacterium]
MQSNISIIVALAQNMAIGKDNDLLWHIGDDLRRFKQLTTGHTVIMGRRTFESLPKRPLPKRRNIVITRNSDFSYEGAEIFHSVAEAAAAVAGEDEAFVIGGAEVYKQFLPLAKRLYVTWVHADFEADVYFPPLDLSRYRCLSLSQQAVDETSGLCYSYADYELKV